MEEKETTNRKSLFIGIIVVALIVVGVLVSKNPSEKGSNTTEEVIGGVTIEFEDGTTGKGEIVKVDAKKPKLLKKKNIPETLSTEDQEALVLIIDTLGDNPDDFSAWNNYGSFMKLIEDYERAEEAWLYAAAIRPGSSVPSENLGNLYGYYLGDSTAAEHYLLLAIEQEPVRIALYGRAYEFYRDVMGNAGAGVAVIQAGYEVTQNPDLKAFLDSLES